MKMQFFVCLNAPSVYAFMCLRYTLTSLTCAQGGVVTPDVMHKMPISWQAAQLQQI